MPFDDQIISELRELCENLQSEGFFFSRERLSQFYSTFRDRFGPEVLRSMDGETLLENMHNHSNRDSLVYWLEFKNDDEFSGYFGGIGGGSALKYRIYRRRETGEWMTGSSKKQVQLTTEGAIRIAQEHRDQFIRGAELLEALPVDADEAAYRELQIRMDEVAPDVSRLGWGHKYFALLYPEKLDDYHSTVWQRHNLIKILQTPPEGNGRYHCGYFFTRIAQLLDVPMYYTTGTLNKRNGPPCTYWRIEVGEGIDPTKLWKVKREDNYVAMGYPELGDLSWVERSSDSREKLRGLIHEHYPQDPKTLSKNAYVMVRFLTEISEGDIVVATDGKTISWFGRVEGSYTYDPSSNFPYQRQISLFVDCDEMEMPSPLKKSPAGVRKMHSRSDNLVAIERSLLRYREAPDTQSEVTQSLKGISGRIQKILERKGQVILHGPPGTGKTYWAMKAACELASHDLFRMTFDSVTEDQISQIIGTSDGQQGRVRVCCFHPAYGYEDFLEGYRPSVVDGNMIFEPRDGIFKQLCQDAEQEPEGKFYLIIDEINRGDIPRIFGELLLVLERDKRGKHIILPLSRDSFHVPKNVMIIGTMNTADRSIALLDTALRRRFGFIELMPNSSLLAGKTVSGIPLGPWLDSLNQRICEHIGRDARNLQIGHSYLMYDGKPISDINRLVQVIREDIIPLLQEYCYEDYLKLAKILGSGLVDGERQQVRDHLFDIAYREDFIRALLQPSPELTTSTQVVTSEDDVEEEDEEDQDDQE